MRLRYTERAAAELEAILDSIAAQSPQGAANVQRRMRDVIDLLLEHPHAGHRVGGAGLRRLVVTPYPYLIFYRARRDEVVIHGVRHGARNPATVPR